MPAPDADATRPTEASVHLRIMETTDLHAHVCPYDYYADRAVQNVGLARTASLIAAARSEVPNALLLDNGDFLQGSPLGDYAAEAGCAFDGGTHPVIAAMNAVGVDAGTLGNHEFNYGLDFVEGLLSQARFPLVAANIVRRLGASPRDDAAFVPPYVLLDRTVADAQGRTHPLRIGVIGLAPPQLLLWDRRHLEGRLEARDILEAARFWLPEMRAAGADLIVALSHSGIGAATPDRWMEDASTALAAHTDVDVVLTGHSHLVFPSRAFAGMPDVDVARGTIGGKPAVMAGAFGDHLGVIDLTLERSAGRWRIAASRSEARPICARGGDGAVTALVPSDPDVLDAVRTAHDATLAHIRRSVGRTAAPLHSYFSMLGDDRSLQLVSAAHRWHMGEVLKGTPEAGLPILAASAPFKAGGRGGPDYYTDVPAGDLAYKDVADLYFYPNTVCALKITGLQLAAWLERSAALFRRIVPGGADQMLIDPACPSYNFDVIDGVTYRIDLSQGARFGPDGAPRADGGPRITDLRHAGRPVAPDDRFVIVTNNYRGGGGGAFPGAERSNVIYEAPDLNRDIVLRYVRARGVIDLPVHPTWSFAPMPGTSVLYDTGPGATAYLDEVPNLRVERAGTAPGGFLRLRLHL